jgi:hypothetical protein
VKTEREFDPGQAPVYPLPSREPWGSFAQWGTPPERPGAYERPWDSPGPPPPWVASRPSGPPTWAVVCILVGSALVLVSAAMLLAS